MREERGQILLIVMLATAVILTLVLSVVSRSITDISVTTSEEEALRAFSAAEAGVEEALVQQVAISETGSGEVGVESTDAEADYSYTVARYPEETGDYVYPYDLGSGESGSVWLVPHLSDDDLDNNCTSESCFNSSRIRVCWGQGVTGIQPAIEVSVFYRNPNTSEIEIARVGLDPDGARVAQNHFVDPGNQSCNNVAGEDFDYRYDVNLTASGNPPRIIPAGVNPSAGDYKFVRVRMLYNTDSAQPFAVTRAGGPGIYLPSQGKRIESTGVSGVASRKVSVFALYPEPPAVFDSALFSPFDIVK
jgi:hypothetical protein